MYFLGIDLGGTVTKAGIYDVLGKEMSVSEKNASVLSIQPGFTERNMDELWSSVCHVVQAVLHDINVRFHISADCIKGVSFSSHGKGLYALNGEGKPVRNGIISSDTRALQIVKDWKKEGVDRQAYAKSLQQLWPSQPVALLKWLKDHEPEHYEEIDAILMVHDYVRYKMTGEIAAEVTNISSSNLYNQALGQYDLALMNSFDLEVMDKVAPVIGSTECAGEITAKAATETGLAKGTAVYAGLFDVVAASLSSGVVDQTTLSAVAGTWSIATTVLEEGAVPNSEAVTDYPYIWGKYCTEGQYFVHEGSPTSASNLKWMMQQFFQPAHSGAQDISESNHEQYTKWDAMLLKRQIDRTLDINLLFLPYLFGSNQSLNLKAGFYGMGGHHTQDDLMAAVYQGIVYSHLIHQDRILALNPDIRTVRFTGGPSQSEPWMQLYTDAGGLPLEVVDVKQAGCQAAAMCASVGYGQYANFSDAIAASITNVMVYTPNPIRHQQLREGYTRFIELSDALSNLNT